MNLLKYLLIIGVIYTAGTKGYHWFQNRALAERVTSAGGDIRTMGLASSCRGKARCLIAYVAPWCPACQATEPVFHALPDYLRKSHRDAGFGVVVTDGRTPGDIARKQNQLAPLEVYQDDDGSLRELRQVSGFPTWIVTDAQGKEITRFMGGMNGAQEQNLEALLRELKF